MGWVKVLTTTTVQQEQTIIVILSYHNLQQLKAAFGVFLAMIFKRLVLFNYVVVFR